MAKAVFLALAISLFASHGWAHGEYQWIQERDQRTGDACCGEHDCYAVHVRYERGGYAFRHDELDYLVNYRDAKKSEDGRYWACIIRPGMVRCFFAPPVGS